MIERIPVGDYIDIQRHQYRGLSFFTAIFGDHVICEPTHVEFMVLLDDSDLDKEELWADSAHSWANGLSFDEQRDRLIEGAKEQIDYLLDGEKMNDFVDTVNERLLRMTEQHKKLKELAGEQL